MEICCRTVKQISIPARGLLELSEEGSISAAPLVRIGWTNPELNKSTVLAADAARGEAPPPVQVGPFERAAWCSFGVSVCAWGLGVRLSFAAGAPPENTLSGA